MIKRFFRQRFPFYLILAGLCCIIPIIFTMALVTVTGDRERSMSIAVIPEVVFTHFIFSIIFLKSRPILKYTLPFLTALLSIIVLKYILPLDFIHNLFDQYGFWEIALTHLVTAIILWELVYQLMFKPVAIKQRIQAK